MRHQRLALIPIDSTRKNLETQPQKIAIKWGRTKHLDTRPNIPYYSTCDLSTP